MFINRDARHLIEVRESPGKGLGVFAKDNIPRGTRILAESSLLKVENDNPDAKKILQAFEDLTPSQQSSYLELHRYTFDSDKQILEAQMGQTWDEMAEMHRKVLNIYTANSFPSIYLLGSRFNHSCVPNTTHSYHPSLDKETFHTIQDITAGEELLITYIDGSNWDRSRRQKYLQKWGFQCNCPVCEDTPQGRAKEEKRLELSYLTDEFQDLLSLETEESLEEALKLTQKLAAIQKSEGLVGHELRYSYVGS
ncbi:SET domain containing protein [Talaromyces stipitatus ATCC 10500]|uniref:SET domain containing protein n=1 Tax=Talaromyces stipitatus (strain ATCC 10500 / CBS 375.48 / QM 6759 / NRRL 1006) TaxID=441959 RepID=B8MTU9_TALSN|nr:SET domain containing protein [Talaromyces stipitatus ATCC 10500]EED12492.1 SET domain containing protein [Talaromyces stipitatus ATCC 10500]